jgi:hypothetical protein
MRTRLRAIQPLMLRSDLVDFSAVLEAASHVFEPIEGLGCRSQSLFGSEHESLSAVFRNELGMELIYGGKGASFSS